MNKPGKLFVFSLLVILELYSAVCSEADDAKFEILINERGTRFTEKIRVNENENTVSFDVPKHNNVNPSEVLNDFNLGLTITRVPDVGMCHVKPLEKGLSNPGKLKADMNYVEKMKGWDDRNLSVSVISTEWTIDKQLVKKYLSPTVVKFCGDLPVYSLKEVTKDGNDSISQRNRRGADFQLCPNMMNGQNRFKAQLCNPDKWILNCKFQPLGTCVWWAKCALPIKDLGNDLLNCKFVHQWHSVVCCVTICPTPAPTK